MEIGDQDAIEEFNSFREEKIYSIKDIFLFIMGILLGLFLGYYLKKKKN